MKTLQDSLALIFYNWFQLMQVGAGVKADQHPFLLPGYLLSPWGCGFVVWKPSP